MEYVAAAIVVFAVFVARASKQATTLLLASILYFQLAQVTVDSIAVYVGLVVFVLASKLLGVI